MNGGEMWPARVSLCSALCTLLSEALPDLWRLGQSYFCGELKGHNQLENQDKFKVDFLGVNL